MLTYTTGITRHVVCCVGNAFFVGWIGNEAIPVIYHGGISFWAHCSLKNDSYALVNNVDVTSCFRGSIYSDGLEDYSPELQTLYLLATPSHDATIVTNLEAFERVGNRWMIIEKDEYILHDILPSETALEIDIDPVIFYLNGQWYFSESEEDFEKFAWKKIIRIKDLQVQHGHLQNLEGIL